MLEVATSPPLLRSLARAVLLPVAGAMALLACSSEENDGERQSASGPPPPHIVLVLVDTLRADHTSVYGYEKGTTPELEKIAAEGVVMRRHFANAPWTKPSVASILTGLHPTAHGSRIGQFNASTSNEGPRVELLSEKNLTFVEVLQDAGYRTASHVSNYNLLAKWGYDQGYDRYELVPRASDDVVLASDRESMEFVLEELDRADRPTFVWSHMMAVHQYKSPGFDAEFRDPGETPIDPNGRVAGRVMGFGSLEKALARYDGSIKYCDMLIGELYRALQERHPNTILIVTSDHGEEFYDHGGYEHCETLYSELLRVPAIIAGAGVPKGKEITKITDSIDVFPTVLSLAGIDTSEIPRMGTPMVTGRGSLGGKSETFAEQHHRGPFIAFAATRDGGRLIESYRKFPKKMDHTRTGKLVRREFYDAADTTERVELIAQKPDTDVTDFADVIQNYRQATRAWFDGSIVDRAELAVAD
ncbi:MAG: sulfatase, partial [Planctomycetota bacterium]